MTAAGKNTPTLPLTSGPKSELEHLVFGVGSFHLYPIGDNIKTYTAQEYAEFLKSSLGKIDSISNITIFLDYDIKDDIIEFFEVDTGRDSKKPWYPQGLSTTTMGFSFDIYIPYRIQDEIHFESNMSQFTKTERFRVITKYGFYSQFSYIICVGSDIDAQGSEAVVVVRKFLEKKFSDDKTIGLGFYFIGPSPFHANFYIAPKEEKTDLKGNEYYPVAEIERGYDKIVFHYDQNEDKLDEIVRKVFRDIGDDLDLFYHLERERGFLLNKYIDTYNEIDEIINREIESSSPGFSNFFSKNNAIKKAILSNTKMEMIDIEKRFNFSLETTRHNFSIGAPIKRYIDHVFDDQNPFPAAQFRDMLSFLDNRRRHFDTVTTTLIAAVFGGAIGGLIALLAK